MISTKIVYLSLLSSLLLYIFNIFYNSYVKYHKHEIKFLYISLVNILFINVIYMYLEWKASVLTQPFV